MMMKPQSGNMRANTLMGQHFLHDIHVLERIITEAKIGAEDTVLEVGPGRGILTQELAQKAKKVIAIEKDPHLVEGLQKQFADRQNIEIIHGDILKTNLSKILPRRYVVVANLPYYLTSRFLRVFLDPPSWSAPSRMLLMVQREVAVRICAEPPDMNMLALSVQAFGKPKILFRVGREAFSPCPAVESAVIEIDEISDAFFQKNKVGKERFFALAKKAFQQKRKTLKNSLGVSPSASGQRRPQVLSLDDWSQLVSEIKEG